MPSGALLIRAPQSNAERRPGKLFLAQHKHGTYRSTLITLTHPATADSVRTYGEI